MARLPGLLQGPAGLLAQGVALGVLAADVQKAHPGPLQAQGLGGVEAAQVRELDQILHRTLRVGAAVHQHQPPPGGGHQGRHGRPADALDALDQQRARAEQGPGAAGGDEGVPHAVLQQVQPDGHGRVLLGLEGRGRVVVHVDDLGGAGHRHRPRQPAALGRGGADLVLPAHQHDLQARAGLGGVQRASDNLQGGVVPAHGVNNDFHWHTPFSRPAGPAGRQ